MTVTAHLLALDFSRDVLALWSGEQLHQTGWTVAMGALVAVACGWLGCWLILQGLALIGDAISHTVLLGIVVAFLLTGQSSGAAMFVGAALTGLVTVLLVDGLHASSRLKEDAALGIVFTGLFALGVVLLTALAGRAHIDKDHVLFGQLEFVAIGPSVALAGGEAPRAVCEMAVIAAMVVGLSLAFHKELLLTAFDPQLAASLGLRPRLVRYGMLGALSLTTVGAFRVVGAFLAVAMLIVPAATAALLTRRLAAMFAWTTVIGVLSSVIAYPFVYHLNVSGAGGMVCVASALFGLAFLFAPEQGLVSSFVRRWRRRLQTSQENLVRRLWKLSGSDPAAERTIAELAAALPMPRWQFLWSLRALARRGWTRAVAGGNALLLTELGATEGRRLDRAHRLWESYLVASVGLASDHVHPSAEELEHALDEELIERLDDDLGRPAVDPHGAPIPRSGGNEPPPAVTGAAS